MSETLAAVFLAVVGAGWNKHVLGVPHMTLRDLVGVVESAVIAVVADGLSGAMGFVGAC